MPRFTQKRTPFFKNIFVIYPIITNLELFLDLPRLGKSNEKNRNNTSFSTWFTQCKTPFLKTIFLWFTQILHIKVFLIYPVRVNRMKNNNKKWNFLLNLPKVKHLFYCVFVWFTQILLMITFSDLPSSGKSMKFF